MPLLGRRAAIGLAGGSALAGFRARADTACSLPSVNLYEPNSEEITSAKRLAIEVDELEPQPAFVRPQRPEHLPISWWNRPELQKKYPVSWETRQEYSADEGHLPSVPSYHQFDLSHDLLERWANANSFKLKAQKLVLFGVRGAKIVTPPTNWIAQLAVTPQFPDHIQNRCLVGAWDRENRRLVAYTGSTVPNVDCMYWQLYLGSNQHSCNMMSTGCYPFVVCPFTGRSSGMIYPSCFVLTEEIFARRTFNDLVYGIDDWAHDVWPTGDDVHPAFFDEDKYQNRFSSAGCQTVCGNWDEQRRRYLRGFSALRVAAGLPCVLAKGGPTSKGKPFSYLLVSAAELMLFANGPDLPRLRHGSEGKAVTDLWTALARKLAKPTASLSTADIGSRSRFDGNLTATLVEWQKQKNRPRSGILAPADAAMLGVEL